MASVPYTTLSRTAQQAGLTPKLRAHGPRHAPLLVIAACLLLACVHSVWAGYQFGVGNQSIQIAFLQTHHNPSLFARDVAIRSTLPDYPSFFFWLLAPLLHFTDVPTLYFALYLLTTAGVFLVTAAFARRLSPHFWTPFVVLLALLAGHHQALAGESLTSVGFTHTYAVFPLCLLALLLFLHNRLLLAFALLGLLVNFHALEAAYLAAALAFVVLCELPKTGLRRPALAFVLFLLTACPTLYLLVTHRPDSFDSTWVGLMRLRSSEHSFPSSWWHSGVPELPRLACILGLASLAFNSIRTRRLRRMLLLLAVGFTLQFVAGYLFTEVWPIPIFIRVQLFRGSRFVLLLTLLITAHACVQAWQVPFRRKHHTTRFLGWLEFAGATLTGLALIFPSCLPLLPLALLFATLLALIQARLAWHQALIAGCALWLTLFAWQSTHFLIPGLSPEISWHTLLTWSGPSLLATGAILVATVFWLLANPRYANRLPLVLRAVPLVLALSMATILLVSPRLRESAPLDPDWLDAQLWARDHTPTHALFLTPPRPLSSFRICADRSIVGEWRDGTQLYFSPAFAAPWAERMHALQPPRGLLALSDEELLTLGHHYQADYIVLPRATPRSLSIAHENETWIVYAVPAPPPAIIAPTTSAIVQSPVPPLPPPWSVPSPAVTPLPVATAPTTLITPTQIAASATARDPTSNPDLPPYKNPALSAEQRAADLLSRMTLAEKAQQLEMEPRENTRLGIPACSWWSEGLHGMGEVGRATMFPQAIALAATWDPPLIRKVAAAIGDEARVRFDPEGTRYRGITIFAPAVDMARDPRWGRNQETYGEDPRLTSRIAIAYIQGLQGDDRTYLRAAAIPKHLALYGHETDRLAGQAEVSERAFHDYYLPAFHAALIEGKAAGVMSSHTAIKGLPSSVNPTLLSDLLRKEWKFTGPVVTDYMAPSFLVEYHHLYKTREEAAAACIKAGVDVLCDHWIVGSTVLRAVDEGRLAEKDLDRAVLRNLTLRFRLGFFDSPELVPYARTPRSVLGSKEHLALARQAAVESIVLLRNDPLPARANQPVLPLDMTRVRSIAVVGPYADRFNLGAYSSAPINSISILDALKQAVGKDVQVRTAEWEDDAAVRSLAKECDVVLAVAGLNQNLEAETMDHSSLDLPRRQRAFIQSCLESNPATIVVLQGAGPVSFTSLKVKIPTLLLNWYPGEQGGPALADVLLGKHNPAGRLPLTYYRDLADVPALMDYEVDHGRTYMYLEKPPAFPFGHGLSYTTFVYRELKLDRSTLTAQDTLQLTAQITNTGTRDGDEVVQLYVHKTKSPLKRPLQQLQAFQRLAIPAGKSVTVTFAVPIRDLAFWDDKTHQFVVEPGAYELSVAASSAAVQLRGTVVVQQP